MTLVITLTVVVLVGVVTFAVSLTVRRRYSSLHELDPDPWTTTLGYVASAYGIVVGFSVVFLFGEFADARQSVGDEAAALLTAYEQARLVGDGVDDVRVSLACYASAVPEYEWPALRRGQTAEEVDRGYGEIFRSLERASAAGGADGSVGVSRVLSTLEDVSIARQVRLSAATTRIPALVQVFLVAGGGLVVALIFVASLRARPRVQALLVATAAAFTAVMIAMLFQLSRPFRDDGSSVKPAAIEAAFEVMEADDPSLVGASCPGGGP